MADVRAGKRLAFTVAILVAAAAFAIPLILLARSAGAANSPTFRDCALAGGIDPDFVRISKVDVNGDNLTVPKDRRHVTIEASESSLPGDGQNKVAFKVKVKAAGTKTKKLSDHATGKVVLAVPLHKRHEGQKYTISWSAVFDNGGHPCPADNTPQNTTPKPFVVKVEKPPAYRGTPARSR